MYSRDITTLIILLKFKTCTASVYFSTIYHPYSNWSLFLCTLGCLHSAKLIIRMVNLYISHEKINACMYNGAVLQFNNCPKVKYHLHFFISYVQPVANWELFEKHLCNQSSHYKKHAWYHAPHLYQLLSAFLKVKYP